MRCDSADREAPAPRPALAAADRGTVFPEPWSPAVFNSELALRKGRLYRAAWVGDDMAGYIGFMIVDDEAHMTTLATAPDYQRAGVATTLIVDGIRTLRADGIRHLSFEVAANNDPAQSLYRRFGFAPVGGAQELLPGHRAGRAGHVGLRHRLRRVRARGWRNWPADGVATEGAAPGPRPTAQ